MSCIHTFDFVPFLGIVCTKCSEVATTETTPIGHVCAPRSAGRICPGCGLIREHTEPQGGAT